MKKRVLSVILALVMVIAVFSCAAFAYEDDIDGIMGDADGNGKVELADVRMVLKAAAGTMSIPDENVVRRCDINADGILSLYDARRILRATIGLDTLEPSGAFKGVVDADGIFESKEELVRYFNDNLDRIKIERPGFTKINSSNIKNIDVENPTFIIPIGVLTDTLVDQLKGKITEEGNDSEITYVMRGEKNYTKVSVEEEEYVSNLAANDVYGAKVSLDEDKNELTVMIAIADTVSGELAQSSYSKVFNTEAMSSTAVSTLMGIFGTVISGDNVKIEYKNATLTAVFDYTTGNVKSYKTEFASNIFVSTADSDFVFNKLLSVDAVNIDKITSVEYKNFDWAE